MALTAWLFSETTRTTCRVHAPFHHGGFRVDYRRNVSMTLVLTVIGSQPVHELSSCTV
jgi:hypothetical protein